MKSRITSICLDRHEQPKHAVIRTSLGVVRVDWQNVCGDRCWFTTGGLDARKLAVTAITRLKRMFASV